MPFSLVAIRVAFLVLTMILAAGCASPVARQSTPAVAKATTASHYLIGPGDNLRVFVWRHPDISVEEVPVRPDGKISTPLVEDMVAAGKTPTQLARDIEKVLSKHLRTPAVTIIITSFVGTFGAQVRVVGQAANPQALSYRDKLTLLDVMIEVGGLAEFAAGNRAKIVRRTGGKETVINVRLEDLIRKGDIGANVVMRPGDIVIIPQSRF